MQSNLSRFIDLYTCTMYFWTPDLSHSAYIHLFELAFKRFSNCWWLLIFKKNKYHAFHLYCFVIRVLNGAVFWRLIQTIKCSLGLKLQSYIPIVFNYTSLVVLRPITENNGKIMTSSNLVCHIKHLEISLI